MVEDAVIVQDGSRLDRTVVAAVVRELLSAVPTGCTWLLPVTDDAGQLLDFVVAGVSGRGKDIYGRGTGRLGERLSELYPSMVDGPLWRLYRQVLETGVSGELTDFRYADRRSGVVADSEFEVSVQRVLGGPPVWGHRVD